MSRLIPAAAVLLTGALFAGTALAGPELLVEIEAATLDSHGNHLVVDVEVRNPTDAEVFVLLSEVLVFGSELAEARCPANSPVLTGPPGLQLRPQGEDVAAAGCAQEPRPPGPQWRRGILKLEAGQRVGLLVAVGDPVPLDVLERVRFGVSWATAEELPRRLARWAYGAEGIFLSAHLVTGPSGGGRRIARMFPRRASSTGGPVHRRDRAVE